MENIFAEKIRNARSQKGFVQKEMASLLGMSLSGYNKIETGKSKLTVSLAKKIAEILNIPISDLIEGSLQPIEIKNGNNSPVTIQQYSTLIMQNEKLLENQNKIAEQMLLFMNEQMALMKSMAKYLK